ncbi:hypothetical protein GE061_013357 [Apolygus lucorum]|uniref:Uncharacterized protein n=1 Tax=Apolygus lucorum TaxID=248454 RepID=A0A8S9XMS4_APOLU|nr:hypothetical protein GE061_013357 [Apolygus lucorum]
MATEAELRAQLAALQLVVDEQGEANEHFRRRLEEADRERTVLERAVEIVDRGVRPPPPVDPRPPVEEFCSRVRKAGRVGHWEDGDLVSMCLLKLTGAAAAFVEASPALAREDLQFRELEEALLGRFSDPRGWEKGEEELRNIIQGHKEGIRAFADRVAEVGRRAIRPGATEAETGWLRGEGVRRTLQAFVKGLRGEVGRVLALETPLELQQAVDRAITVEAALANRQAVDDQKKVYPVREGTEGGAEPQEEALAARVVAQPVAPAPTGVVVPRTSEGYQYTSETPVREKELEKLCLHNVELWFSSPVKKLIRLKQPRADAGAALAGEGGGAELPLEADGLRGREAGVRLLAAEGQLNNPPLLEGE